MGTTRKIPAEVPEELLAEAQKASGKNHAEGANCIAAGCGFATYVRSQRLRGKVRFVICLLETFLKLQCCTAQETTRFSKGNYPLTTSKPLW